MTALEQDRTLDYFCYSVNWMVCQMDARRRRTPSQTLRRVVAWLVAPYYLESYLCYTPTADWTRQPWLRQFVRQANGYTPATRKWIIFVKPASR